MSVRNTSIEGSVSVGRDVTTGGDATVRGRATVKRNLKVEGWLDAPNVKQPCMGLFGTEESLNKSYPHPRDGWYAYVGDSLPADIYRCEAGKWVRTGKQGGEPNLGIDRIEEEISNLHDDVDTLGSDVEGMATDIAEFKSESEGYLFAGTKTFKRGQLNVKATGGEYPQLQVCDLEKGKDYVILFYNSSPLSDIRLYSSSGTPLYTIPRKHTNWARVTGTECGVRFGTSLEGEGTEANLYYMVGEHDKNDTLQAEVNEMQTQMAELASLIRDNAESISELKRLIDEETGEIIPDLNFVIRVELI